MAAMGFLRMSQAGVKCLRIPLLKPANFLGNVSNSNLVALRQMGHGPRKMVIRPGRLEWDQFKDEAHFFFMLGIIPLGAIIIYANVFIGKAELADIPEGYEPEFHEYYSHPIERWFAKYIYSGPEREYEKHMQVINDEAMRAKLGKRDAKVKELMRMRGDYKAWYYFPTDVAQLEQARKDVRLQEYEHGTKS